MSILLSVIGLCISLYTLAVMQQSKTVHSVATIKTVGIGVYQDFECTLPLASINWGILEPDETKNFTAWIRNESNVPETLALEAENWVPSNASDHITLSWNYDGSTIEVGQVVEIAFTLHVLPTITGIKDFTFDMVIIGSG